MRQDSCNKYLSLLIPAYGFYFVLIDFCGFGSSKAKSLFNSNNNNNNKKVRYLSYWKLLHLLELKRGGNSSYQVLFTLK